jgi:hypothetical protein
MKITISTVPAVGVDSAFVFNESNVGPGWRQFYPIAVTNNYHEDVMVSLKKITVVNDGGLLGATTLSFQGHYLNSLILPSDIDFSRELNEFLTCVPAGARQDELVTGIAIDPGAKNVYQGTGLTLEYQLHLESVAQCPPALSPTTPMPIPTPPLAPPATPTSSPSLPLMTGENELGEAGSEVNGQEAGAAGVPLATKGPSQRELTKQQNSVTIEAVEETIAQAVSAGVTGLGQRCTQVNCCPTYLLFLILFFCILNFILLLSLLKRKRREKNNHEKK